MLDNFEGSKIFECVTNALAYHCTITENFVCVL